MVDVVVLTHRRGVAAERVLEPEQPDADDRRCLVGDGAYVHVLAIMGAAHQLYGDVAQILSGHPDVDPEQSARVQQPSEVMVELDQVDLLMVGVPVTADPLEGPGAVVEGVGGDGHPGFLDGNELPIQVGHTFGGEAGVRHGPEAYPVACGLEESSWAARYAGWLTGRWHTKRSQT